MKEFIEKLTSRLEEESYTIYLDGYIVSTEKKVVEFTDVQNIINQLAEKYKDGWIPVSERLPDVEADVLLSLRSLDVYTGFRANTEGCFYVEGEGYVKFENVLAWMPLPEPYQSKEDKVWQK